MTTTQTREEINDNGIMAGMTVHEIREFMSTEFKDTLMAMRGTEHFDKVHHLWWLTSNALMYAHGHGLLEKIMTRMPADVTVPDVSVQAHDADDSDGPAVH